jgi:hypothetical protein
MMLDMLHNEIEILVGRAEAHSLGPHAARRLMSLIRQMANAERAHGKAEGKAEAKLEATTKGETDG